VSTGMRYQASECGGILKPYTAPQAMSKCALAGTEASARCASLTRRVGLSKISYLCLVLVLGVLAVDLVLVLFWLTHYGTRVCVYVRECLRTHVYVLLECLCRCISHA
jgi:hypothetical protein